MPTEQIWDEKIHLVMGDVVYTHLYAYVDPAKMQGPSLQTAFTFQATVRAGGADLWDTGAIPLTNGSISAAPTLASVTSLGPVQGEIDDWGFVGASWAAATAVRFLVVAKADVTLPISLLGGLIGGIIGGLIGKIRVTVGHTNVILPIDRDATGNITAINHVTVQ